MDKYLKIEKLGEGTRGLVLSATDAKITSKVPMALFIRPKTARAGRSWR